MMSVLNKSSITLLFVSILSVLLLSQFIWIQNNGINERIQWDKNRPLTWKDFKGEPDSMLKNKYLAISWCGIQTSYALSKNKDSLLVGLKAHFNTKLSWVVTKSSSKNLLNHEQTHFNIVELYARKLRKVISTEKVYKKKISESIDKLFYDNDKLKNQYQNLYDKETNLSRNKVKQKEWEKKVAKELLELEMYSDTLVKVKLY
jgi:hypothetical protein